MLSLQIDLMSLHLDKTFPLLGLPAELRQSIYSFIILSPHKQDVSTYWWRGAQKYRQYYQQRRVCHETAKSLLLASRQVYFEAITLFCQQKTFVMCQSGHDLSSLSLYNNILASQSATSRDIQHLEFNLHSDQACNHDMLDLHRPFSAINNLLKHHIRNLPCLQSVTYKINEGFDPGDNRRISEHAFDFGIEFTDTRRQMAIMPPGSTSWDHRQSSPNKFTDILIRGAESFYSYSSGARRTFFRETHWVCTQAIYSSLWEITSFASYEMKFERKPGHEQLWDMEVENDVGNVGDVDAMEGIISELLKDYDDVMEE